MAKLKIVGMREYDFKDEESGRQVSGMSVYYIAPLNDNPNDGLKARGFTVGKLTVKAKTDLYARMVGLNYDKPFEADCQFDLIPGDTRPTLQDIKV